MEHQYHAFQEKVSLVPMDLESSEKYRIVRNHEENRKWFLSEEKISLRSQREWFQKYLLAENEYMFSILDESKIFIGGCGLYGIDKDRGKGEFGRIAIEPERKFAGYGYLATVAAVRIAKEELGLKELLLEVKRNNISAQKMYMKAGFQYCISGKKNMKDIMMERMSIRL